MKISYDTVDTPLGELYVAVDEAGVCKVALSAAEWEAYAAERGGVPRDTVRCSEAVWQLREYFQGERREFDLPLSVHGTPFRQQVWAALCEIPYGEVRSYVQIAERIGKPKGPRAIGQANRHNPLPILIPCHRVIGKNGSLVGYAGPRTDLKSVLLELEGVLPAR
ncbi:methylated-DNA-[protein]-cysteine S-methyltransferase [Tumebacillus sp. BK434]|uniref:methylated-DNA--[protein]-cysteine S-methyltransferase n=1 Tax=Tumebacillus sp. BK434 TaxID=2512169 RepID=UPI00104773C1|nr:methylated-DNA--[protein]-cysteine S-methyltransferase [Tumebacillus sp. BK434]TCP52825.1 methylated-DNA-[protein]-cysteine S-methyltransferase [Tumebacillus sp. BK434]